MSSSTPMLSAKQADLALKDSQVSSYFSSLQSINLDCLAHDLDIPYIVLLLDTLHLQDNHKSLRTSRS